MGTKHWSGLGDCRFRSRPVISGVIGAHDPGIEAARCHPGPVRTEPQTLERQNGTGGPMRDAREILLRGDWGVAGVTGYGKREQLADRRINKTQMIPMISPLSHIHTTTTRILDFRSNQTISVRSDKVKFENRKKVSKVRTCQPSNFQTFNPLNRREWRSACRYRSSRRLRRTPSYLAHLRA